MTEMEDILEPLLPQDVRPYCGLIAKRLEKCLLSSNTQIIEKTLCKWNNKVFVTLMMKDKENCEVLAKGTYNALRFCSERHSSESLKQMAQHVLGLFVDSNMELIEKLSEEYDNKNK